MLTSRLLDSSVSIESALESRTLRENILSREPGIMRSTLGYDSVLLKNISGNAGFHSQINIIHKIIETVYFEAAPQITVVHLVFHNPIYSDNCFIKLLLDNLWPLAPLLLFPVMPDNCTSTNDWKISQGLHPPCSGGRWELTPPVLAGQLRQLICKASYIIRRRLWDRSQHKFSFSRRIRERHRLRH